MCRSLNKNVMPFTTDLNKYLNISPIRHLQDLYTENDKMLMKKILKVPKLAEGKKS